jgi:hypothetical protein
MHRASGPGCSITAYPRHHALHRLEADADVGQGLVLAANLAGHEEARAQDDKPEHHDEPSETSHA